MKNANSKIKYGLNDTMRLKKKVLYILKIDPFIPSIMNFQTIVMTKLNLAKILSVKSWSVKTILILSMLKVHSLSNYFYLVKLD